MPLFQLFVLAAVQGITEFLPISSSGHLVLVPKFTNWPDQGLLMDVAVHVGTLLAVMLYFYQDIAAMTGAMFRSFKQISTRRRLDPEFWLVWKLVIATLPVVIAGYLMNTYFENAFRSVEVIGWTTLGFGILLFLADKLNMTIRSVEHITLSGCFCNWLISNFSIHSGDQQGRHYHDSSPLPGRGTSRCSAFLTPFIHSGNRRGRGPQGPRTLQKWQRRIIERRVNSRGHVLRFCLGSHHIFDGLA